MQKIILYTTAGCHLCEQAEELLRYVASEVAVEWQPVDIADDPSLLERYGIRIPVLQREDDGSELGWPFDIDGLRFFLSV
ncbi:MAG: glutaredoxin family protein [Gammaproteobacteria bacterium]|nr:glutaredoxin family protein [Gammaproteobacteria bacterium]